MDQFLEDGTKQKIPSEIAPSYSKLKPEFKTSDTLTQYLTFFHHISILVSREHPMLKPEFKTSARTVQWVDRSPESCVHAQPHQRCRWSIYSGSEFIDT